MNSTNDDPKPRSFLEEAFETVLFNCRFLVLLAVIGTMAATITMFIKGCIEVIEGLRAFVTGFGSTLPTAADDKTVILSFIPAIDNYLFAAILLIISMGLYELFISEIDPKSRQAMSRPTWLRINDLDDLTSRIGEVVIMILIVNFFRVSFSVQYDHALDLLELAAGVLTVSGSLVVAHYVSNRRQARRHAPPMPPRSGGLQPDADAHD